MLDSHASRRHTVPARHAPRRRRRRATIDSSHPTTDLPSTLPSQHLALHHACFNRFRQFYTVSFPQIQLIELVN